MEKTRLINRLINERLISNDNSTTGAPRVCAVVRSFQEWPRLAHFDDDDLRVGWLIHHVTHHLRHRRPPELPEEVCCRDFVPTECQTCINAHQSFRPVVFEVTDRQFVWHKISKSSLMYVYFISHQCATNITSCAGGRHNMPPPPAG